MFRILVQKELKSILVSPKFTATFITCSILIIMSVFIGIQEYKANVKQYEAVNQLNEIEMSQASSWLGLRNKVHRFPDPMQIFVSGINNDIGRFSNISAHQDNKLQHSIYSDDPIFAVFRFLDFSFIVLIVLSLFAIIFTYDSINGERESGTLKLVFSNSVSRAKFILSKFIGSWLGLTIPLLIPILIGILLVLLYNIPFSIEHWIRLLILLFISMLFFTFFMSFGILISSLARRSSLSFLFLLMSWVIIIFIIPRIGIMISGQMIPVPSVAQKESIVESYSKDVWNKHSESLTQDWKKRESEMANMTTDEKEAYREDNSWAWMQEDDRKRKETEKEISDYTRKANEDLRNRRIEQEKLAFIISRFSPASAYQLGAMNIAGTNIDVKTNYENELQNFKNIFTDFTQKKQKEAGMSGMMMIKMDTKTGVSITEGRKESGLDLKEVPRFSYPAYSISSIFGASLIDIGLLSLFTILSFAGSFIVFLRSELK
jgi:ABC-type transport system involved in multi-copper enzyme maturation permease subunit